MIKSLRRRFVAIAMAAVCLITALMAISINVVISRRHIVYTNQIMENIAEGNADFEARDVVKPSRFSFFNFYATEESAYETRWFTVLFPKNGDAPVVDISHIAAVSAERAALLAREARSLREARGLIDKYKFHLFEQDGGLMVVFLDPTLLSQNVLTFRWVSALVSVANWILIFIILCCISGRAIRPAVKRIERQRQFITDAGHELKTPLAILSANADVLSLTAGENEWIDSIRAQVARMDELIRDLLTLSRIDEDPEEKRFSPFSVSDVAEKTAEAFDALFSARNITFEKQIEARVVMTGNEQSVAKLIAILLENAAKYTPEGGRARLSVSRARKEVRIAAENTVEQMPQGNLNALFSRFYRADASRSRETGGSGIGLSIAKSVAEQHGGQISARRKDEHTIVFCAEFKNV